jgi:hypothetical protein
MDMKRVLRQDRPQGECLAAYPLRVRVRVRVRVLAPLLLVVALAAIAVAGYWLKRPAEAQLVPCADPLAGCSFRHRGATVIVRFSVRPEPLEAFQINVQAPGSTRLSAEFQMVGMEMGFNRYDLRPSGNSMFTSNVTLPVCVSGRRDWMLRLDIDGSHYSLPFSTQ